jgi:hypothetical protein
LLAGLLEPDQVVVDVVSGRDDRVSISVQSLDAVPVVRGGSDESDSSVAVVAQVRHRREAPDPVLDVDPRESLVVGRVADDDHLRAAIAQCRYQAVAAGTGGHDDAVDEPVGNPGGHCVRAVLGGTERKDREFEVVVEAALLDTGHQRRVVGVAEKLVDLDEHHQSDEAGSARDERPCRRVGLVSRLLDHRLDSLTDRRPDVRMVVQHARDRRPRHAGPLADFLERQVPPTALACAVHPSFPPMSRARPAPITSSVHGRRHDNYPAEP